MPDRSRPPKVYPIDQLTLAPPQKHVLDCGIPVYVVNMGTQDIVKVDFIIHAGRPYEAKKMVARAALTMIKEGTENYTAAQIAEQLDFYGSTLSFPVNLDTSNIALYSLTKYFEKMAALLGDLLLRPIFPLKELESYKQNSKQRLLVDLAQPDTIAYRTITEQLFGADHPYGYNSSPEGYDLLQRQDLINHWKNTIVASRCKVILSGKVGVQQVELLNQYLKEIPTHSGTPPKFPIVKRSLIAQKIHVPLEGAIQSAIRIGRRLHINRKHEDFKGLLILNTVLGGYFGSRLMTNIREEKGYTYNIYSTVDSLYEDSYFCIATEVSTDKVVATKTEIYKEIQRLIDAPVGQAEMEMVRSYMMGNLLTMLDGPFNVANVVKTMVAEELPSDDFERLAAEIKSITATRLQELAKKYLSRSEMWEVVVGAASAKGN